jgi:hypothetical protein
MAARLEAAPTTELVSPMSDFHDDILDPDEMELIHSAMVGRFCWFEHVGRFSRYQSYRTFGIQPRDPDKDDESSEAGADPAEIVLDRVVCLRPIDTTNSTPNRGDRQFRMAINHRDLPPSIGLDRSHGPAMNMAAGLRATYPEWSNAYVFMEVAHKLGSFVSYSLSVPTAIRVWTKGSSTYNPETWPLLTSTDETQVYDF